MPTRRELANAIRFLSIDAVQKANSGHPGMPMGMADIAEVLWNDFLNHDPQHPSWPNRDRFVVSNGHGSMLLYALLHLSGYALSIEDLQQFRQWQSKTPGHPEYGITVGVETTTGPLGQGLANAVGMALAERMLAAQYNKPGHTIVDHYTYVFVGDGCLMEGISHEVCSLAGTLGLGKLIVLWDDNGISIDGAVKAWFNEDTPARFRAYGWHVISAVDGHDPDAIRAAIVSAREITDKPSFIACKTVIGFGAPNVAGTAKTHGSPLGTAEIEATRKALAWPYGPFEVPNDITQAWDAKVRGKEKERAWSLRWEAYKQAYPQQAEELTRRWSSMLPEHWESQAEAFIARCQQQMNTMATRKASQTSLDALAPILPELVGGSADLTESNNTHWSAAMVHSQTEHRGNYLYYGVREFGMSAVMNGLALYGGFIPFGGTFLTFSDYARNAVRMAALMKQRVIFVYTHDSVGLGEDGPTHQPVEHIAMLRITPNVSVWRPCDQVETAVAWKAAIEQKSKPTCLLLSRQNLPAMVRCPKTVTAIARGGYILKDCQKDPVLLLMATGSEVALAIELAEYLLVEKQVAVRVVSLPSLDVFQQQTQAYRDTVLPPAIKKRIAIEAAHPSSWHPYIGSEGRVLGIDHFGESAPASVLWEKFGFTVKYLLSICTEMRVI